MSSATQATFAPPVMQARRWLEGASFRPEQPLINVSQAAPVDPPPEALRHAMADLVVNLPQAHLYGPVLGLPDLRAQIAQDWSAAYDASINAEQVAITSGCNQAFAASISAIAGSGDNVILPCPWYFNHKMWLDMAGVETRALQVGPDMTPCPEQARALITKRTRAIVLVSPNNPTGAEYPAALMQAFYDLARETGIALIIDETYRDFHSVEEAPHGLFQQDGWDETVIQLYSFSKAFRLTGHRVGAIVTSQARLSEVEKFLDTVTICPNQLAQLSALWGLQNLGDWLAGERLEILKRRAAITRNMPVLAPQGWRLLGCGAYFAYLEHPFDMPSDQLAQALVQEAGILALPGTMFMPDNSQEAAHQIRIAFANVDAAGIEQLFARLAAVTFPLAPSGRPE